LSVAVLESARSSVGQHQVYTQDREPLSENDWCKGWAISDDREFGRKTHTVSGHIAPPDVARVVGYFYPRLPFHMATNARE